jgi:hypothetical protein
MCAETDDDSLPPGLFGNNKVCNGTYEDKISGISTCYREQVSQMVLMFRPVCHKQYNSGHIAHKVTQDYTYRCEEYGAEKINPCRFPGLFPGFQIIQVFQHSSHTCRPV